MNELRAFLADPPAFLRQNHVRFRGACSLAPGATGSFLLLRVDGRRARTGRLFLGMAVGRRDAGVYEIRYAQSHNIPDRDENLGAFDAVWSGYQSEAAVQCALDGQGADIMLTPELTGCTVASTSGPDGSARFSHYNLRDPAAPKRTMDAAGMRAHAALDFAGSPHALLTKEAYYGMARRGGPAQATVIGWRKGGAWSFWVQYVEQAGQVAKIRDVERMRPGTRFG